MLSSRAASAPGPTCTSMPAARAAAREALACHQRVGVFERGHHAGHAGGDQCVAARAGAALVGTGFERHMGGRAPSGFARAWASRKAITSACGRHAPGCDRGR
jgi:hypothetical protein